MSLKQSLQKVIRSRGPISIANYMQQSLVHPTEGYYVTRDPLGARGDFTTSPEISQMFGEIIGINLITQWMALGQPSQIRIAELGPGRGTLMSDLLRATNVFKAFQNCVQHVDLVEASPVLREKQADAIGPLVAKNALNWLDSVKQIPTDGLPTFIIAHEFFDALPIHQFEKSEDQRWIERVVDYDSETDQFRFTMSKNKDLNQHLTAILNAQPRFKNLTSGASIEICPEAWSIANDIAAILQKNTGGLLVMDYGPAATIPTQSFRAFKSHHQVDPLSVEPGQADLTADVDFKALSDIFTGHRLFVNGPVKQADWLHRMGIGARATMLANNQTTEEGKKRIASAYNRLVDLNAMGKTYKVMGVSTSAKPIEGFKAPV